MRNYAEIQEDDRYTEQEIDEIINEHKEYIMEFTRDAEWSYADWGMYNQYDSMKVLFNLNSAECYLHLSGQGIYQDWYEGIEEGYVIGVHQFRSGELQDAADEGLTWGSDDEEAVILYRKYENEEISEDQYYDKYDEIIQPWMDEYYEQYIDVFVEIEIDYLNSLANEDFMGN